jgi:hypothetical protein
VHHYRDQDARIASPNGASVNMIEQQGAGSGWGRPLALLDGATIHWAFAPIRFPAILNASPTPHAMASPALTLAVVDDHHLMRPGLAHTVGDWPHARQVVEAEDGVDFERVIAEVGHIHIAIIDRQMPKRDGFDTLRWMGRVIRVHFLRPCRG